MSIYALVDCNNFYVSCERIFNPRLEGKPVVVLSNNDGCIISRSNEAKQLGVPMGAPFFEWKKFFQHHHVTALSSNYELYGDLSKRVMRSLQELCPDMEVYSIDEAFLQLENFKNRDLFTYATDIRKKIKMWTGMPVSIGIAPTKTLAKIANHLAKSKTSGSVFSLLAPELQEQILADFPLEKVWGIGRQLFKKLQHINIYTVKQLRDADPKKLRHYFSVVMEKMVYELRGVACIGFEEIQPKKQIISSRSFGKLITELIDLEEAISHYAATASLKLREQKSVAAGINVFLQTNVFNEQAPHYTNSVTYNFPIPTADTREIIGLAKKCLQQIYKKGYWYQKAGIMLLDLSPEAINQTDLFNRASSQSKALMNIIDVINKNYGNNTIFLAAQGITRPWQAKFAHRSLRYTTRWDELLTIGK